jgi:hypothetical protein
MFGRHKDFIEFFRKAALSRAFLDRFGDLFLEIRIGVDDIPPLGHEFFHQSLVERSA